MQEEDLHKKARLLTTTNQNQKLVVKQRSFVISINGRVTSSTNVLGFKPRTTQRVPPGKPMLLRRMKVELVTVKS